SPLRRVPMAQQTEAACLLETGLMYPRRIGLRAGADPGALTLAGFKPGGASIYWGDEPIVHFDLEGRWQRAFVAGVHYRKGLDTSVHRIDRVREGSSLVLRRRALGPTQTLDLDASVRTLALDLIGGLSSGRLDPIDPPATAGRIDPEELRTFLERVVRWDAAAWRDHREHYRRTYGPLPWLPPDCPNAVVLQATLGHAGGRAFGGAVVAEHRVRSIPEFEEHALAVSRLLGRRVVQCRTLFLAGADLLRRPADEVEAYLRAAGRLFPVAPGPARPWAKDRPEDAACLDGIHAFLDDYSPPPPDREAWHRFRDLHLRRVALGIESGAVEIRALYGTCWADEDLRATVAAVKEAGFAVSVLVLVGAGGEENGDRHATATAELITTLELTPGDYVYLLDADEVGGEAARESLRGRGLTPVGTSARLQQQALLKDRLATLKARTGAKVVPYSLEKQPS
ncbi:MAG TPA: hypothetical protein VF590_14705, partial [Isosphaeraceae bacterium]